MEPRVRVPVVNSHGMEARIRNSELLHVFEDSPVVNSHVLPFAILENTEGKDTPLKRKVHDESLQEVGLRGHARRRPEEPAVRGMALLKGPNTPAVKEEDRGVGWRRAAVEVLAYIWLPFPAWSAKHHFLHLVCGFGLVRVEHVVDGEVWVLVLGVGLDARADDLPGRASLFRYALDLEPSVRVLAVAGLY